MENNKKCEGILEDRDLEKVSGGRYVTIMYCKICNWKEWREGNFFQQTFDCPRCGKHFFTGIEVQGS